LVRWDKVGTVRADDYIFLDVKGNEDNKSGTGFFVHYQTVSAVKGADFISDRMAYIVLKGRCCHIFVLNLYAPREKKN
jgi:hypothetical protein